MSMFVDLPMVLVGLVRSGAEDVISDRYAARRIEALLASQGWDTHALFEPETTEVLAAIGRLLELLPEPSADETFSFADLRVLADGLGEVADALPTMGSIAPTTHIRMAGDLLYALALEGLATWAPPLSTGLAGVGVLARREGDAIVDNGRELRAESAVPGIDFRQLAAIVSDPAEALEALFAEDGRYGPSVAMDALAAFARSLGLLSSTRAGADIAGRPYVVVDASGAPPPFSMRLTAQPGALQLGLQGDLSFAATGKRWSLDLSASGGPASLSIDRSGVSADPAAAPGAASVMLRQIDGTPPLRLAIPKGPGITMGDISFGAEVVSDGAAGLVFTAEIGSLTILLAPGSGDGFLRTAFGEHAEGVETELSLSFVPGEGLTLGGGAAMERSIPLNKSAFGGRLTLALARIAIKGADEAVTAELTVDGGLKLGPVAVVVVDVGVSIRLSNTPDVSFRPPTGLGLALDVGPVEGGGFVSYSPDTGRYVGAMELQIGTLGLTAFGIIDTQMPDGSDGFSMLVLVTGRFTPIPIGFGFTLNALGGLLGIHRDVDVDALFGAIRAGTARDLLAPEDPVRDAPRLARQAGAVFPVTRGQHVFGPTLQLGWGSPKQVITLDLGLAVTLPDPLRFILIGTVRAVLPEEKLAIARLNVDIAGVLNLSASRFDLEGRIYDSVIQALPITGGFAMRSSWGRDRSFAFSIGGVHPGFTPPANFPVLDRMGVDLSRGSSFQFRLGGYFAITSNSLQLGARADLKVRQGGFVLLADVGFDALFIFDPFGMDLYIYAGASIKRGSTTLLSMRIEARLRGPGPWHVSGSASVRILFLKVSIGFSKSFGQEPSELAVPVDGAALIEAALMTPRSWIVEGASHAGDIVLDELGEALGPYSPLAVQQKVAPLELRLEQLGGRRLTGPRRFEIRRLELPGGDLAPRKALKGAFAPAQFTEMTERERLSAPSFEDLVAGASFAGDDVVEVEGSLTADTSMEMIILDAPPPSPVLAARLRREMVIEHRPQAVSRAHPKQVPAARIAVRSESWIATDETLAAAGEPGTHAQLRQTAAGAVLARAGEVAA